MRTQILYIVTIGAALIVPAVAIHVGGFLAYLATVAAFVGACWQVACRERRAIARAARAVRPQPAAHPQQEAPSGD